MKHGYLVQIYGEDGAILEQHFHKHFKYAVQDYRDLMKIYDFHVRVVGVVIDFGEEV